MKVILYMAITPNGMIARPNGETPWSDEEFASYFHMVKLHGHAIVGNKTYPQFLPADFESMGHPLLLVPTRNLSLVNTEKIIYFHSASEAISILQAKGFNSALVTGGSETNSLFASLVDEIYLDVEPMIFGAGKPLFTPHDFEYKLKLLAAKNISTQTLQLHYQVLK